MSVLSLWKSAPRRGHLFPVESSFQLSPYTDIRSRKYPYMEYNLPSQTCHWGDRTWHLNARVNPLLIFFYVSSMFVIHLDFLYFCCIILLKEVVCLCSCFSDRWAGGISYIRDLVSYFFVPPGIVLAHNVVNKKYICTRDSNDWFTSYLTGRKRITEIGP